MKPRVYQSIIVIVALVALGAGYLAATGCAGQLRPEDARRAMVQCQGVVQVAKEEIALLDGPRKTCLLALAEATEEVCRAGAEGAAGLSVTDAIRIGFRAARLGAALAGDLKTCERMLRATASTGAGEVVP